MALQLECPACAASLTFSDALVGKTVKCKECGEPVTVKAPVVKAKPIAKAKVIAVEDEEFDDEPVKPKKKAAKAADYDDDEPVKPKKKAKKSYDEDDEDDAPKPKKKKKTSKDDEDEEPKKSMMPIMIAVIAGVVVIGGGVGAFLAFGGKGKDVAGVTTAKTTDPKPTEPETTPTYVTAPTTKPEAPATRPVVIPPSSKPTQPEYVPPTAPKRERPTKQSPDRETMERMKKAAVYLEVEDAKGGGSSGSGWFGLEPNLIFTNAHVLDMKAPNSKPPAKITAYYNSGIKGQQVEIPHAKLKLLAVDREMDLAVLEVVNMPNLPSPLMLRETSSLVDLEKVVALGFPGGRRLADRNKSKDPPVVTVSETAIQALRNDENGNLYSVQVQGGIVHGNSGGAICDADGYCIGVAVRVDLDSEGRFTNIAYGVPTEFVSGLLAGRIANVAYDQAYLKDGKVVVPVTVKCLDPRKRLQEVGIAYWVGDSDKEHRKPGDTLSAKPSDSEVQEVKLQYNAAKQEATGELVFPAIQAGRVFWTQPYYGNALTKKYYMSGLPVKMVGNPVEHVAANLTAKFKVSTRRETKITSTQALNIFEEGDERDRDERTLRKYIFDLTEQVTAAKPEDTGAVARLVYGFKKFDINLIEGTNTEKIPKELRDIMESQLKLCNLTMTASKEGELTFKSFLSSGGAAITDPTIVQRFGNMASEILRKGTIKLPNKTVNAGESWNTSATFTIQVKNAGPAPKGPNPTPAKPKEYKYREDVKYTYLGVRERGGKKEAVVKIEGVVLPAAGMPPDSANGSVRGFVMIEESTGTIVETDIKHEYDIDSSEKGMKKRISGIEDFQMSRGSAMN